MDTHNLRKLEVPAGVAVHSTTVENHYGSLQTAHCIGSLGTQALPYRTSPSFITHGSSISRTLSRNNSALQ